jgi:hypothetical protein
MIKSIFFRNLTMSVISFYLSVIHINNLYATV